MTVAPPLLEDLRRQIRQAEGGFGDGSLRRHVPTGLAALDRELPGGGLPAGALTELLMDDADPGGAWSLAALMAAAAGAGGRGPSVGGEPSRDSALFSEERSPEKRSAENRSAEKLSPEKDRFRGGGRIVWIDSPPGEPLGVHPPALAAFGIDLRRLLLVRPKSAADGLWAFDQAVRCRAVAATCGILRGLNTALTRRLQLAAELGGGLALAVRPAREAGRPSAAAVRLRVGPAVSVGFCQGGFPGAEPDTCDLADSPIPTAWLPPRQIFVDVMRARGAVASVRVLLEVDDHGYARRANLAGLRAVEKRSQHQKIDSGSLQNSGAECRGDGAREDDFVHCASAPLHRPRRTRARRR